MNVNYILVALAVLTIACIYLFWLTFKQSQEILALSSRVNNSDVLDGGGGEKNNKVITEVIKKVGEIDNNLNEVNKYIFGNLIPRLEGRHSTNDDVQAEEDGVYCGAPRVRPRHYNVLLRRPAAAATATATAGGGGLTASDGNVRARTSAGLWLV